jgi:mannose-6-phosphate isomerase-like protein (cupin superfamily)
VPSGSIEVEVGRELYSLEAGDAITDWPRTPHLARNVGQSPSRAIFVLTPPSF